MASQSYLQVINQQKSVGLSRYSDWLSRFVSKDGVAKNMRDVLRKLTPQEEHVKCKNFTTIFRLPLSLGCFGKNSRKSVNSAYPLNSIK